MGNVVKISGKMHGEICGSNFRLTSRINEIPSGSMFENTRAQKCAVVRIHEISNGSMGESTKAEISAVVNIK